MFSYVVHQCPEVLAKFTQIVLFVNQFYAQLTVRPGLCIYLITVLVKTYIFYV